MQLLLDPKYGLKLTPNFLEWAMVQAAYGGHRHIIGSLAERAGLSTPLGNPGLRVELLWQAVCHSKENIVRALLESGLHVNDNNLTTYKLGGYKNILQVAAIRGRVGIVLKYGVNRHVPALIDAVKNGHEDVARLLLDEPGGTISTSSRCSMVRKAFFVAETNVIRHVVGRR